VLTQDRATGDYFEALATACGEPKTASNWVMTDVLQALRERSLDIAQFPIAPSALGELLRAVDRGELTIVSAKQAFVRMLERGEDARTAIETLGLRKITDEGVLAPLVAAALAALPQAVAAVQQGELRALDALKGNVMRATRGRADPSAVDRLLRAAIGI
jgi:aspartyl-tRNA(Asn)/glutamyl-tRNA(Gln) amidotransferase subunit B